MKSLLHHSLRSSNPTPSLRFISSIPPINQFLPQPSDTPAANRLAARHLVSGSHNNALKVLDQIPHPNLTSYYLTISCYNQTSRFTDSLRTFRHMRFTGHEPNQFIYRSILTACSSSIQLGEQVHALVLKNGFCVNGYVSTGLIDLYAKAFRFGDAIRVFSESCTENVVCWNSIIAGAVGNGEYVVALDIYRRMMGGPCMPNVFTFSSVLCACAAASELDVGRGVHATVVKCNAGDDVFVGTAIIDLYAKCGEMDAAVEVFNQMPVRNVVSWTAVISGFVQEEDAVVALSFFKQMMQCNVDVNEFTLTSVITACAKSLMINETHQIHCWMLKNGLFTDIVAKDALISTYAKIGDVHMSEKVFEEIDEMKSPGAWSAMISGFAQSQSPRKSVELFKRMFQEGLKPDVKCSSSVLSIVDCVDFGKQMHSYLVKVGLVLDVLVGSALFTMYSKCGNINDSHDLFKQMEERDRVSWTSMIAGLASHGHPYQAFSLFKDMLLEDINPDQMAISAILTACDNYKFLLKGKEIHGHAFRVGFATDTLIGSYLISMYSRCKNMVSARRVFSQVPQKDRVIWSSLVSGYAANGYNDEALAEFRQMVIGGFGIDHVVSSSVVAVCAYLSSQCSGMQLHGHVIKAGLLCHLSLSSALVTMYSKCGSLCDSREVFDEIEYPDLVTWSAMIDGYAQHGNGLEALKVFRLMKEAQVKPDSVTLVSVLSACRHCNLVEEAFVHFNSMSTGYGIEPEAHHYACIVDLLSRSGRLKEAADFIYRMPIKPDFLVWSTLLAACRTYGDVELGKVAARKVLEMEPHDSGAYISLSNMSADMWDWEGVTRIRSSMKESGMKKEIGRSMV